MEQAAGHYANDQHNGHLTIAIDGPSGAGKSTVARLVADHLGLAYIDTGAMYRAVALKAMEEGVDPGDSPALGRLAGEAVIELVPTGGGLEIWLDGRNVTLAIRGREVSGLVARVAAVPEVRAWLVQRQRELAARGGVVMEGRDIGTNVLPGAPYKFYITADPAVRAHRRSDECRADTEPARQVVAREMTERDRLDAARPADPLCAADDAVVLDSTSLSAEQVAEQIWSRVTGRG
ncbi:MAG TPA: (d)CMP kinase [Spirochaetia bacterium]|nr:(d)CMP kinase [Spirochaetia bacterium]